MSLTEKQIKSIELLLSGIPQKQVAQELGVNAKTLQRWSKIPEYNAKLNGILTVATEQATERATEVVKQKTLDDMVLLGERDELRQEQYRRLEIAQNALMAEVERGDIRAITAFTKVSESIRALYGLDVKKDILDAFEIFLKAGILPYDVCNKYLSYCNEFHRKIKNLTNEPPPVWLDEIDFSTLTEDQLRRLANGDSPTEVLADKDFKKFKLSKLNN